jgi:hypothetical protein
MSNARPSSASSDASQKDLGDLIEDKRVEITICADQLTQLQQLKNKDLRPYELAHFLKEEPGLLLGIPINDISPKKFMEQVDLAVSLDTTLLTMENEHKHTNDYLKRMGRLDQAKGLPEEYKGLKEQADQQKAAVYNLINFDNVDKLLAATQQEMERHKSDLAKLLADLAKVEPPSQSASPNKPPQPQPATSIASKLLSWFYKPLTAKSEKPASTNNKTKNIPR